MSKAQKLASVGLTDTPEDIAKFYKMFPTSESYDAYMNVEKKYAMGGITNGIAFPQQPDASSRRVPYYDKGGFFAPNVMPWNGPIGFYQDGGLSPEIVDQFNTGQISRQDIYDGDTPGLGIPYRNPEILEGPEPQGYTDDMTVSGRGSGDMYYEDPSDLDRSNNRRPGGGGGHGSFKRDWNRFKTRAKSKLRGIGRNIKKSIKGAVKKCTPDGCYYFDEGGAIVGVAFPQQPTENMYFSAFPWNPQYQKGGRIGVTGNMTGGLDREALMAMDPENMDTDLRNINDKRLMLEYQRNLKNGPFADKFPVSLVGTLGAQSGLGRDIIYNNRGDATGMTDWNPSVSPSGSIGLRWNAGERSRRNKGLSMAGSNWGVGASYENQGLYPYMEINPRADYPLNKNLTAFGEYDLRLRPDIGIGPMSTQGELYSGAAKNNLMLGLAGNYNGIQPTLSGGYNFATQSPVFQGGVNIPLKRMGGGLPGGPNEGMPCMECGGYMEDGGATQYGGMVDEEGEMDYFKEGGNWIQKATASIKKRGTEGVCTGSKFGGPGCPPGSKRYNLAKTFRKMAKKEYGGMAGAGMDDTDSYVQNYNQAFQERILPQQEEMMMGQEGMPMAYNGMTIPQSYNMNMFGYNPAGSYGNDQNQPVNRQNVMNMYNMGKANRRMQNANMGFLGAAFDAAKPFYDPSRKYVEHKFTEWKPDGTKGQEMKVKHGGMLNQFQGTGNSQVSLQDFYNQEAEREALDIWNRYKNPGGTNTKYNADPNDANYQEILRRVRGKYGTDNTNTNTNTAPKWDANDPGKYFDWYFNNRRSANNQTNYNYGDWNSWNNVSRNADGTISYNTPGGGFAAAPIGAYLDKTFGEKSDYMWAPGSAKSLFSKGLFGRERRKPTGFQIDFNVYRKSPLEQKKEEQQNKNKSVQGPREADYRNYEGPFADVDKNDLPDYLQIPDNKTMEMVYSNKPSFSNFMRNQVSPFSYPEVTQNQDEPFPTERDSKTLVGPREQNRFGGYHALPMAVGGMENNTPNSINNMLTPLDKMNPEGSVGKFTYSEQEKKTPLSGQQKASAIMAGVGLGNYFVNQNEMQRNMLNMPTTADEIYDPIEAGRTGFRGNIGATGPITGVPFGGTGTTYGIQRGMYGEYGGQFAEGGAYEVGDVVDLTDEEIQALKDQGYVIEDAETDMDDFA